LTGRRAELARTIADLPGIHFNGLVRRLDLAPGQVQYHLRELLGDGDIVRSSLYGQTHYFPPEYGAFQRGALAVCHRETARDVLLHLLEHGPSEPAAVARSLGIARSTLEWHLDHLVEQGLVEKRRDGKRRVTLALANPSETAALLAEIEPALPDRLVDRFTRLVDRFLAE
jgi:predicted transcriptional regulator